MESAFATTKVVDGFADAKTLKSVAAAVLKLFSLETGVSGGNCAIERPILGGKRGLERRTGEFAKGI